MQALCGERSVPVDEWPEIFTKLPQTGLFGLWEKASRGIVLPDGRVAQAACTHSQVARLVENVCPSVETGGQTVDQRLLNWKLRRAFMRPYFLRSTTRGSRVRKPATFRMPRRSGS
jgi:hypothetical protein